jgi:uncharacterized protein YqhQ
MRARRMTKSGGLFFVSGVLNMAEHTPAPLVVGGQAVVEGVMMRSPRSLAIAVRRKNQAIVLKESAWRSIWERWRFLRWPFLRGVVVLIESLMNGISALNFSARVAMLDQEATGSVPSSLSDLTKLTEKKETDWAIVGTLILSIGLAVGLFIALPHLAVWLGSMAVGRELNIREFLFHLIVGFVKLGVFMGYIALISLIPDVRRVFMYHGAEHQSIHTYEAKEPLTVENARRHTPLHPRCGTTFLILVIGLSILVFAIVFPMLLWFLGDPTGVRWLNQVIYILIKVPLLLPIAGLAYELQKLTSRHLGSWWARGLAWPGMAIQRMTTRPPTDDQLEVALSSLQKTLWRERVGQGQQAEMGQVFEFENYQQVLKELGE